MQESGALGQSIKNNQSIDKSYPTWGKRLKKRKEALIEKVIH